MKDQNKGDLRINGNGSASGGTYDTVVINGSGTITGDLECSDLKINGSAMLKGNVKTDTGKVNGSAGIQGKVKAKDFNINGSANVRGDLESKYLKINGSAEIEGSVKADDVLLRGGVRINKDCNAETFDAKGGFTIDGLLNANIVDIAVYFRAQVREIGGGTITIKKGNTFGLRELFRSVFSASHTFDDMNVETIEGDEVSLENTRAKIVRGNIVTIGQGCSIDLVEYKSGLKIHDQSRVTEQKKI